MSNFYRDDFNSNIDFDDKIAFKNCKYVTEFYQSKVIEKIIKNNTIIAEKITIFAENGDIEVTTQFYNKDGSLKIKNTIKTIFNDEGVITEAVI